MSITSRLRAAFARNRIDPTERYLAQATSLVDLEQREREISRGLFTQRRHY